MAFQNRDLPVVVNDPATTTTESNKGDLPSDGEKVDQKTIEEVSVTQFHALLVLSNKVWAVDGKDENEWFWQFKVFHCG